MSEPESIDYTVVDRLAHDPTSYTQGLVLHDGILFESSGLYGESRLSGTRRDDHSSVGSVDLDPEVFAEGLAVTQGGELVQLTWKEQVAFRWRAAGFTYDARPIGKFHYDGEGWGLTTLGNGNLIMSDGSDELVERESRTFRILTRHRVERRGGAADALNELEFDGSSVWANRYQSDEILRIDPGCWTVTGVVDVSALRGEAQRIARGGGTRIDVTNGIAFDADTHTYLITGKWWPILFEVDFDG